MARNRVHQVLCAAGRYDAITTQALAFRRRFERWGWGGSDHAAQIDPGLDADIGPLSTLSFEASDALLIHYSGYVPGLEALARRAGRTLLVYHNITPPRWFWAYDSGVALHCALGREQLAEIARAVDVAAGVSEFNAGELRAAGAPAASVLPILFDRDRLPQPAADPPAGPPRVLFVGRLAPHKRQDDVIRAFELYRRRHAPDARLTLVGEPLSPAFGARIRDLADELAPGAVEIEERVDAAELWECYRSAHAFLCLSEHEGFCIPLLEAFHFGVPVVARAAAGIPETSGDAALLADDDDLAVFAELLHVAAGDDGLRAELRRRGDARLECFDAERTAELLRAAVTG